MSLQVIQARGIYAGARPERPRAPRAMAIIHRSTGASAIAAPSTIAAKVNTPKARKLSGPRFRVEAIEATK